MFRVLFRRNWASKEKGKGASNGAGARNGKVKITGNVTVTARVPAGNSKGICNVTGNNKGDGDGNSANNIHGKVQGTIPPELAPAKKRVRVPITTTGAGNGKVKDYR